ncbi:MAG: hypothetical protein HOH43_26355 [Candidatus Latescibacteria bacterium]|jgi:hypothetical protein|nr:hypothetical protein [Candidatus Latescibacterota bacterium]
MLNYNQRERVLVGILIGVGLLVGVPVLRGGIDDGFMAVMIISILGSLLGFMVWQVSTSRTERMRIKAQTDLLNQLMKKFESPEAFVAFLDSPSGQRVYDGIAYSRKDRQRMVSGNTGEYVDAEPAYTESF